MKNEFNFDQVEIASGLSLIKSKKKTFPRLEGGGWEREKFSGKHFGPVFQLPKNTEIALSFI